MSRGAGQALARMIVASKLNRQQVSALARLSPTSISKACNEDPRLSVRGARRVAEACKANARETVELLAHHVTDGPVWKLDVSGLAWDEVCALVAVVEGMRRARGLVGACVECDAGPGQTCRCSEGGAF